MLLILDLVLGIDATGSGPAACEALFREVPQRGQFRLLIFIQMRRRRFPGRARLLPERIELTFSVSATALDSGARLRLACGSAPWSYNSRRGASTNRYFPVRSARSGLHRYEVYG